FTRALLLSILTDLKLEKHNDSVELKEDTRQVHESMQYSFDDTRK
ncbi:hypothetical protein CEXT_671041, partial [Caerostris extrusa]